MEFNSKKERDSSWQRVDDEHPLLESVSGSTFSTSTAAHSRPSMDTALLIKSAARSVLDCGSNNMTSPNCNASDAGSSSVGQPGTTRVSASGANTTPTTKTTADLASLQRQKLPAMPDEQDRKRFVGCLAAVLAASYDFDVLETCNDDNKDALEVESMAFFEEDEDAPVMQKLPQPLQGTVGGNLQSTDSFGEYATSNSKQWKGVQVSRKQHRKRRYDVLSRLLLQSAEYLLLEKHQAKAFLPMLSRILVPEPKNQKENVISSPPKKKFHNDTSTTSRTAVLQAITDVPIDDFESRDSDIVNREIDDIDYLRPFLESMSPGGGFRCLTLVMLQHLMQSQEGYDARVRQALKTLGVIILYRDMSLDYTSDLASDVRDSQSNASMADCSQHQQGHHPPTDLVTLATRRFECLEHCIAAILLDISRKQQQQQNKKSGPKGRAASGEYKGYSREQIVRGIKVGAMGVAAAGLFAVTGGLAAPGIAAGVAAIPGLAATAAAATTVLTSTAAVTAIFGVGGGTLVAYKMNRRTMGLTEFEFRRETGQQQSEDGVKNKTDVEAELFTTICISGWLRDECDFQRPWGVSPANPWIKDRQELVERFYAVYRPDHISKSRKILKSWEGEEDELWKLLKEKYGRDPDHLYPLSGGPREEGALTLDQTEVVKQLFVELGYIIKDKNKTMTTSKTRFNWKKKHGDDAEIQRKAIHQSISTDSLRGHNFSQTGSTAGISSVTSSMMETDMIISASDPDDIDDPKDLIPKHVATVWDYRSRYGGELYTVRWESELLQDLCESVKDLAYEMVHRGTRQLLKHTALSTLLSAIAWPAVLVNAANMIDGTWTLAVERADEAGKELARSLLFSKAGHRPVTLVGFSFGARAIYSCLKEMAKYQEKWNKHKESAKSNLHGKRSNRAETDEYEPFSEIREPASIIEDVVMMGLPNHLSISSWKACRQVVSGRLVNCFSQKDLILSLMFQFKRLGLKPVCGTLPVSVPGVENFDVSDLIGGHQDYCTASGEILKRVRLGEPFRSKPIRVFNPDNIPSPDGATMQDKFDL